MGDKKYYAVKKGKTRGIFAAWEECRASVEGYPGAEYKGFKELAEAQGYLEGTGHSERAGQAVPRPEHQAASWPEAAPEERPEPGTLLVYVDGSYDDSLRKYAFGCVFILPDGRVCTEYGNGEKEQALKHRNVSGEMLGAMYAVRTAMVSGFGQVELRYDYEGIEKWVTGQWRSKTELTGLYAASMREWGKKIKICFTKVAAHANVYYNELADKMAKTGLREGRGTPKVRNLEEKWNG